MTGFEVLPAIDLRGGRVVRLRQGDFAREISFPDDPVQTACRFAEAGARWLHVVDLDGARAGEPRQAEIIRRIIRSIPKNTSVEVAGGLRSSSAVDALLAIGAQRVVLGTLAIRDPDVAGSLVARHGAASVAVAIDIRAGRAEVNAWQGATLGIDAIAAMRGLRDVGVTTFEVTSIERDGMLAGPDLTVLRELAEESGTSVIAAGGIRSVADLADVRDRGCTGAIIGMALYSGSLDLVAALALSRGASVEASQALTPTDVCRASG